MDNSEKSSVKVRGPTPCEQPSLEIYRLRTANLINAYPIHREGSAMRASLSDDERVRLFMWGLQEDSKMPSKRTDRLPGHNPLVVADSAREFFQHGDTVMDARVADERAKATLSAKEGMAAETRKPVARTLVRIGGMIVTGVAVVGVAYYFYRFWRK